MFSERIWVNNIADAAFKSRAPTPTSTTRQDKSPANQAHNVVASQLSSQSHVQILTAADEIKLGLPPTRPKTKAVVVKSESAILSSSLRDQRSGGGLEAKSLSSSFLPSSRLNEVPPTLPTPLLATTSVHTSTTATTPTLPLTLPTPTPNTSILDSTLDTTLDTLALDATTTDPSLEDATMKIEIKMNEKSDIEPKPLPLVAIAPPPLPVSVAPVATTRAERRNDIVNEIVHTETTYVDSLHAIVEVFSKPLSRMAEDSDSMILTHSEVQKIFNNIEVLSTFNVYFLNNLKTRTQEWDQNSVTKIGDLFLQFVPFFRMYSQYTANYEGVPQFIQELLTKNMKFARFCEEACLRPNCGVGLISLLVGPVQRVPRYQLLLQELLKNTPQEHHDYEDLQKALTLVTSVASQIDQDLAAQENRLSIHRFQDCFAESLSFVSPSRRLIRHGRLTKISSKGDQDFEFFLFNDLLGYANYLKKKQKKYSLARTMDLADFLAVELTCVNPPDSNAMVVDEKMSASSPGPSPASRPLFTFVLTGKTESLALGYHDQAQVQAWVKDLSKCIEEAQKQISLHTKRVHRSERCSQKIEWKPDGSVTHCPHCGAAFTMFIRKHHCRQCGNVVCAQCSTTKKVVLGRTERVCDSCSENGVPRHVGSGNMPEINLDLWHQQVQEFVARPDWGRANVEAGRNCKWWRLDEDIDRYKPTHNIFKSHLSISNSQAVKAEAIIHAPPRSVCAYLNGDSLDGLYENVEMIRAFGETHLIHHTIKTIGNFWNATQRDFVFLRDCRKLGEGAFSIVCKSVQSPLVPPQRNITRGVTLISGYLIRPHSENPNHTHVTYVAHYDPRGSVPAWMKDRIYYDQRRLVRHLQTCGPEMSKIERARNIPSYKQVSWTDLLQACGLNPPTAINTAALRAQEREDELHLYHSSPATVRHTTPTKRSTAHTQQKRAYSPGATPVSPYPQRHRGPPLAPSEEERLRKAHANSASKSRSRGSPAFPEMSPERIDHTGSSPEKFRIESPVVVHDADQDYKLGQSPTPLGSVKRAAETRIQSVDLQRVSSPALKRSQSYFVRSSPLALTPHVNSSTFYSATDFATLRNTPQKLSLNGSHSSIHITPPSSSSSFTSTSSISPQFDSLSRPRLRSSPKPSSSSSFSSVESKSPEIVRHFSRLLLDETKRTPPKSHSHSSSLSSSGVSPRSHPHPPPPPHFSSPVKQPSSSSSSSFFSSASSSSSSHSTSPSQPLLSPSNKSTDCTPQKLTPSKQDNYTTQTPTKHQVVIHTYSKQKHGRTAPPPPPLPPPPPPPAALPPSLPSQAKQQEEESEPQQQLHQQPSTQLTPSKQQVLYVSPQKPHRSSKKPSSIYRSRSNYELGNQASVEDQENKPRFATEDLVMRFEEIIKTVAESTTVRGGQREALQEITTSNNNVMAAANNKRERRKSRPVSPSKSSSSPPAKDKKLEDQWSLLRQAISIGDSELIDSHLAQIQQKQKMMEEQLLQVQNYLVVDSTGTVVLRMEKELSEANLKLCEARSENDRMVYKLEQLQDKFVKLKKSKACSKCTSQPSAKHVEVSSESEKALPVMVKRRNGARVH